MPMLIEVEERERPYRPSSVWISIIDLSVRIDGCSMDHLTLQVRFWIFLFLYSIRAI